MILGIKQVHHHSCICHCWSWMYLSVGWDPKLYSTCTVLAATGVATTMTYNDLPLAFLLTFCRSPGFYSASRWCGLPRPSSSQLLPVWTEVKGQLSLVVIGNGAKQEVPVNWALSSLSLPPSLLQSYRHTQSAPSHPPSPRFFLPWMCSRHLQGSWTRCLSPTCSWCFVCCRWPWADPQLRSEGIETPCSLSAETKWWV